MYNKISIIILGLLCLSGVAFALPQKVNLAVPFQPQAPFGDWSQVYNEACEEISIIMVMRYVKGKGLSRSEARDEIIKLTKYEEQKHGWSWDIGAGQVVRIIKEYYRWNKVKVIPQASINTIIKQLSLGNPVIIPVAGRVLGNPHYKRPGPVYHMIVLKGYDLAKKEFISNDGGTRFRANYRYKFETVINAIHDWPGEKSDIERGAKNVVVVEK